MPTLNIYDQGLSLPRYRVSGLGKLVVAFTKQLHNLLASLSLAKTELILQLESRAWIPQLLAGFLFSESCLV